MISFVRRSEEAFTDEMYAKLSPMDRALAELMYQRGIKDAKAAEAFLNPSYEQLIDPFLMDGMGRAVELINEAKAAGRRALVYGDYDVDGVCATAITVSTLRLYGLEADYAVPLREEGYGLNIRAVEGLGGKYGLLITVDLGISDVEAVMRARELGLKVIVTDHHQLPNKPSVPDALLHPLLGGYPFPSLCGAGVALKLSQALIGMEAARDYIDLAALATVADMVPLLSENRAIVHEGLKALTAGGRAGIAALKAVSGLTGSVNTGHVGFQLAPRLNAAGRLKDAQTGVELLLTDSAQRAMELAGELDKANGERRAIEQRMLKEAQAQALSYDFIRNPVLIVKGAGWHAGVIGLVAGRLCQQYSCPVMALCQSDGELHGSLRSVKGVHIQRMLTMCDDLLVRYGGHEMAAGVTVKEENAEAFFSRLCEAVKESAKPDTFTPRQEYDIDLSLEYADRALTKRLERLAPFGIGNPAPLLRSDCLNVEKRRACGAAGAHLQLTLRGEGAALDGIAFGKGALEGTLPDKVDCVYALKENEFMGRTSLQMDVKALRPAKGADESAVARMDDELFAMSLLECIRDHILPQSDEKAGKTAMNGEVISNTEDEYPSVSRGTLFIARTRETAMRFLAQNGDSVDLQACSVSDPRCLPTLLILPDITRLSGLWRRVHLLDGEVYPRERAAISARCPMAHVTAAPVSEALRELARSVDADDEPARGLYRLLRARAFMSLDEMTSASGLTRAQTRCALTAFSELSLVEVSEKPFTVRLLPIVKCSLSDSPTIGSIRKLSNRREA